MNNTNTIKAIITVVTGFLSSLLGILYIPVLLMVACNIIDYATGIFASKYRNQPVDSYRGFRGIAKKISMWLLVVVGAIIDQLLKYAATTVGITMPVTFLIACVVAIWIICNEINQYLREYQGYRCTGSTVFTTIVEKFEITGGRCRKDRREGGRIR